MKIAILSDIHENYHNLQLCINDMRDQKIEQVLFLGDFNNAGVARALATTGIPTFAVRGNNDGDLMAIYRQSVKPDSSLTFHPKTYSEFSCAGNRYFLSHHEDLADIAASSGKFKGVFFGHTHRKSIEEINGCLVVNPGEISAHKYCVSTYAVLDSVKNRCDLRVLSQSVTVRTEPVIHMYKELGFDSHFGI
ncbi:MAG: YfcE family phosphodiesterase [Sphaerochaetaceae bacterium]|nr:YfcE family phosphodiesterase [Sphaerochaetaceae bacterium]